MSICCTRKYFDITSWVAFICLLQQNLILKLECFSSFFQLRNVKCVSTYQRNKIKEKQKIIA